jgi:hypothetical protein
MKLGVKVMPVEISRSIYFECSTFNDTDMAVARNLYYSLFGLVSITDYSCESVYENRSQTYLNFRMIHYFNNYKQGWFEILRLYQVLT